MRSMLEVCGRRARAEQGMSDSSPQNLRPTEYRRSESESETESAALPGGHRASQSIRGDVIAGRYRLVKKLGEGGMGVVWVAHALSLGVDVAIKLIRTGVADADATSRMAREAQASATLGHPAIVRVFDHGMTDLGDPFLVMELVPGETLGAMLDREKKVDVTTAIKLILPLLDGLRCAHERGIVHRDIKPENVLLARDPLGRIQPKLLDFGIAKLEHQPNVSRLTQVGDVLGSPEFMSPEQARGAPDIDQRTDIWSVCVMLYGMLAGRLPFDIKNYNALMQAILHQDPVPTVDLGVGDRELWLIIAKGLSKSRERRWARVSDLGEALAFWLYGHDVDEDACGNSLKAVWLARTLDGQSVRPRGDSSVDLSGAGAEALDRSMPTLRLKLGWARHRVLLLLTPRVQVGLGLVVLLALVSLTYRLIAGSAQAEGLPTASAGSTSAERTNAAAPRRPEPTERSDSVPVESLPVESAGSDRKPQPKPRHWSPPPPQRPKRDYGL